MIEWNEEVKTGIEMIDREDQKLFNMINALEQALDNGSTAPLAQIINGLMEYTLTHFEHEEALCRTSGWPGLEAHQKLHRQLRDQVSALKENAVDPQSLHTFLLQWLVEHIQKADMEYVHWVEGRR